MSDETGQREQQSETTTATETGDKWGDPISEERQEELLGYLDRWEGETDHGDRKGPFSGITLKGAEASWLAEASEPDEFGAVPTLHLETLYSQPLR